MTDKDLSSDTGRVKILLIGDIGRAFADPNAVAELGWEVCANILDGIEAAARDVFAAVGVVMSGSSPRLKSALKAIRESNTGARIFLLAQMHAEPAAMELVGPGSDGIRLADDYFICPIETRKFYESVAGSGPVTIARPVPVPTAQAQQRVEASAGVGASTEMRIKQLEKLATEDDLTGLKNRRYIWEFSRQIIERARATGGRVTLLVFDIDDFKHYNDVYGHLAGDEILRQAAVLMRRCCRSHDVVGRIGGDEFAVVFWDDSQLKSFKKESERRLATAEHPKEAIFVAKRFRKALETAELGQHFASGEGEAGRLHLLGPEGKGVLTISGGLASFPRDASTMEKLFQQADKALLEAKRSGKNRIYLVGRPQNDIEDVES